MGRKSRDSYEDALGLREVETAVADTFEAEFPIVTGRTVEILSAGESPDRIALVDGIETGIELTGIHAGSADDIIGEIMRISDRKRESYSRRGVFATRPIILLGHLGWPTDVKGLVGVEPADSVFDLIRRIPPVPALYDLWEELTEITDPEDFGGGFSEIWLMDDGAKYTSRRDPALRPISFASHRPTGLAFGNGRENAVPIGV
jgi:hypothetical protein